MFEEFSIVFLAEFKRRVGSRAYRVGTIIGLLSIALLVFLPTFLGKAIGGTTKSLIIAGPADLRTSARAMLEGTVKGATRSSDVTIVDEVETVPAHITPEYLDEHHHASTVIVLARKPHGGLSAIAYARDPGGLPTGPLGRALIPLNIALATNVAPTTLVPLSTNPLEVRGIASSRYATEASADIARAIAYGLVFLLYLSIIFNGQAIMSAVAEEKTSRIAELLVASISPSALLAGKVIAIGCAGLIQVVLWTGGGYLLALLAFGGSSAGVEHASGNPSAVLSVANSVTPGEIVAFLVFFLLGFFEFAMLFAAAASLISRTEDLGSVTGPLMLPIVGAFLIAQFTLVSPNSTVSVITSMIPLLSPFVMFTRLVVTEVPLWQTAFAIVANLACVFAVTWASGKVYRVGMLMYGRAPKLSQIVKVLQTS